MTQEMILECTVCQYRATAFGDFVSHPCQMNVIQLIHMLLILSEDRKDSCGQIQLTLEELAIFQEAGVKEGSYAAVGLLSSYGWSVVRGTFDAFIERYPGEYMSHVNNHKKARKKRETKK